MTKIGMGKTCENCGTDNNLTNLHCRSCGVKLPELTMHPALLPQPTRYKAWIRFGLTLVVLIVLGNGAFWVWDNVRWNQAWRHVRQGAWGKLRYDIGPGPVIPPEPDWDARRAYWMTALRGQFHPPVSGENVALALVSGAIAEGMLVDITDEAVVLKKPEGTVNYVKASIAPSQQPRYFAEAFLEPLVSKKIEAEKTEWARRKAAIEAGEITEPVSPTRGSGSDTAGTPNPAPNNPSPSATSEQRIKCGHCGGMGFYAVKNPDGSTERASCPLCDQRGGRVLVLPEQATLCGECNGLGKILIRSSTANPLAASDFKQKGNDDTSASWGKTEKVAQCKMCLGNGFIVAKF